MLLFHRKCGDRVSLVNGQCTALRHVSEFSYGLVFSAEPLRDDEVFQVRIDKKVRSLSRYLARLPRRSGILLFDAGSSSLLVLSPLLASYG